MACLFGTNGYTSLESVLQLAIKDPVKVDIWAFGSLGKHNFENKLVLNGKFDKTIFELF